LIVRFFNFIGANL